MRTDELDTFVMDFVAHRRTRRTKIPLAQTNGYAHPAIIPALAPVVAHALSRFGPPANKRALDHLVNQVITSAMYMPPVRDSVQSAEITPWGRVAFLKAVVELLIRISTD